MTQPSEPNHQLATKEIKDLQQAQRVMYDFITGMTVEARYPTTTIVGYSELMLQEKLGPI